MVNNSNYYRYCFIIMFLNRKNKTKQNWSIVKIWCPEFEAPALPFGSQ